MIYRLIGKLLHDAENVRNIVAQRIHFEHAPDESKGPCLIIRVISGEAEYHLEAESDCANYIVQVDCYDASPTAAHKLYEFVRNRLSGYSGNPEVLNDDGEYVVVNVPEITILRPGALVDEPRDGSDQWSHRWSADFNVFHAQSVPTLT